MAGAQVVLRSNVIQRRFFRLRFPDPGGTVGEDDTVKVVDLVLEDARQPAFGFNLHRLSPACQPFDGHLREHAPRRPANPGRKGSLLSLLRSPRRAI